MWQLNDLKLTSVGLVKSQASSELHELTLKKQAMLCNYQFHFGLDEDFKRYTSDGLY